jgi:hypothetical protein
MNARIKVASTVLRACTVFFAAYWLKNLAVNVTPYVVGAKIYEVTTVVDIDGTLHSAYVVDPRITVSVFQRVLYGASWMAMIIPSLIAFYFAIQLLSRIRQGEYFTLVTTRYLRNMGFALMLATLCDTILPTLVRMILSARNPDGMLGPRYFYDAGDISLFLAGFGFAIIGWVFHEARKIQIENQEFV